MRRTKTIVISGCDSHYFHLLRDMLDSVEPHCRERGIDIGILDYGLTADQAKEIAGRVKANLSPIWKLEVPRNAADKRGPIFESRLFLPDHFPGYEVYFWIDSDAWLQIPASLDDFITGAVTAGAAVVAEAHPTYRFQPRLAFRNLKSFVRGYGLRRGLRLFRKPHLNMGIFAIHADAPHWRLWRDRVIAAATRTGAIAPHDQFAFNEIVYEDAVPTAILPPELNWIVDRGVPAWDPDRALLLMPDRSKPLGIVHLAGPAGKGRVYRCPVEGGGVVAMELRHSTVPRRAEAAPTAASLASSGGSRA